MIGGKGQARRNGSFSFPSAPYFIFEYLEEVRLNFRKILYRDRAEQAIRGCYAQGDSIQRTRPVDSGIQEGQGGG